ncbi:MAG: protein-L-isoaspartate(D-aspartate) O-methyltransferase [Campylobacterota bacterium]|nr:protein-L-isoaspartate(D-aspartate) O-methyltransferase [Campylobacterota bacterium]
MKKLLIFITLVLNTFLYADFADFYYENQKKKLIDIIEQEVQYTSKYLNKEKLDTKVIDAIKDVPRHRFVPPYARINAYKNRPLPIGYGQTISQPYIVAIMTDLLDLKSDDKVLEIGTGSGYQASILSKIVKNVYTIEIIEPLALKTNKLLKELKYNNIHTKIADGYYGWENEAPFDAIIVTAAAASIPPPLIKQLKRGGKMIIPVGSYLYVQHLLLITKNIKGDITIKQIMPVSFVPLTGDH